MDIRIATSCKRGPHRRGARGMAAKHREVFVGRAMLEQFFCIRHLALSDVVLGSTRIHAVDTENQDLPVEGLSLQITHYFLLKRID